MKKRFYAVKRGHTSNVIVKTWDECQLLTDGFSGSKFKGFTFESDAKQFINNKEKLTPLQKKKIKEVKKKKRGQYELYGYCEHRGLFEGKERCLGRFVGTTENGVFTEAVRP